MPKYQNYLIPKEVKYICPPPKVIIPKRKGEPCPNKFSEKLFFEISNKSPLMNRNLIEHSNFHIAIDNLTKNLDYSPRKKNNIQDHDSSYQTKLQGNHKTVVDKPTYDNKDRRRSLPATGKNIYYLRDKNIKIPRESPIQYKRKKTTYAHIAIKPFFILFFNYNLKKIIILFREFIELM